MLVYIRGALAFLAMATCVEFVDALKADFVQALSLLGLLEESACAIIDSTIDILIQWTQLLHHLQSNVGVLGGLHFVNS
jgi:hypothetical protein